VSSAHEESLAREARLLARYLLDVDCPAEMISLYRKANGDRNYDHKGDHDYDHKGDRVTRFAFAHPWSIAYLDAAGALVHGGAALRRKILIMAAILEASPRFVAEFLPAPKSRAATIGLVAWHGTVAALKAIVGLPLIVIARSGA
jgi:hypothetical protein